MKFKVVLSLIYFTNTKADKVSKMLAQMQKQSTCHEIL